jgi:YD repeat-containing protein
MMPMAGWPPTAPSKSPLTAMARSAAKPILAVTPATSPLGAKTWTYVNGTDPWWIVFTDEDGKTRRYQLDAFGRTNQIQEVDGTSTYSTTLKYDLADNLTTIINAINETNYWAFNDAGGVVASADPYLGQWTYVRDFAGRLRVQTDARGDVVSNSYVNASGFQDPLGRVQVQTAFSFNPTNSTLVPAYTNTYVYDSSDDGNYTVPKGFLYKTVDSQGFEKAGYDSLATHNQCHAPFEHQQPRLHHQVHV